MNSPLCSPKALFKLSVSANLDNNVNASNKLLLPEAFAPAITVKGANSISKL